MLKHQSLFILTRPWHAHHEPWLISEWSPKVFVHAHWSVLSTSLCHWSFSRRIWLMTWSSDNTSFVLSHWSVKWLVFVWSLSGHSTQLPLFFLTDVWNYSVMKILSHESGKKWMMMSWIPWSVKLLCDSFFSGHSTPIVFVLSHWCVKLQCNGNSFSRIG